MCFQQTADAEKVPNPVAPVQKNTGYVVFDLETTGLSPFKDEIIEIGAVKVDKEGQIVDTFTTLVKPARPVSEFIRNLTGISNEMLADAPSIYTALPRFNDFVGDAMVIGHNVTFDIAFVQQKAKIYQDIKFLNPYIDTLNDVYQWEVQKTNGKDKLPEQPKNVNRVEEALKETPLPMTEEEKMRQNLTPPTDEFIKTLAGEQNLVYTIGKEGEERFYSDDGIPIYPSNNGAVGKPEIISLKVGDKILTRYGSDRGSYVSPKGTSFEERALPRTTDKNNYHEYEVTKEITQVESAVIAPWFGQKGGGIQYKLPQRISELGDFLKEVTGDDV